jgi:endonuclease G
MTRRGWKIAFLAFLLYGVVSIVYYHLPWSVRFGIYERAPQVDRFFRKGGYELLTAWDELALIGRDASAPIDISYRADQAYGGFPSEGFKLIGKAKLLENKGYSVGYSESRKNPLWVSYRIFDVPELKSGKRPSRFKEDHRTRSQISHSDYTHSGYDRGHMAPNYGIATRYGRDAQLETFLMSNIIPQTPYINRHMWKDLEHRVAERYGRYFSEVWVITGPVFTEPVGRLDSGVDIPSHYYKIMADEHDGELRVLAFLIENDCPPFTRIRKRLVSVDEIEERTGLDFFPDLPDDLQRAVEGEPATRLWPVLRTGFNYRFKGKTY